MLSSFLSHLFPSGNRMPSPSHVPVNFSPLPSFWSKSIKMLPSSCDGRTDWVFAASEKGNKPSRAATQAVYLSCTVAHGGDGERNRPERERERRRAEACQTKPRRAIARTLAIFPSILHGLIFPFAMASASGSFHRSKRQMSGWSS